MCQGGRDVKMMTMLPMSPLTPTVLSAVGNGGDSGYAIRRQGTVMEPWQA